MISEFNIEHSLYLESTFTNRFINHQNLKLKVNQLASQQNIEVKHLGSSVQGREIYRITIGSGKIPILLWSQMHGDEPTGTLAFFDLLNFLLADDEHNNIRQQLLEKCTLHFIPMLNPDGAEAYTRRNAQDIDINRDFLKKQTPEAKLLVSQQAEIKPDFCFNMHDQETIWSVAGTKKSAAISLLAPPADEKATITESRFKAIQVISSIYEKIAKEIPGHIGRWSEEFEPRSFGDNFQRLGSATILVEAGGYPLDFEKQYVRKLNFDILVHAFIQISTNQYTSQKTNTYFDIPNNSKELFHILIKNCLIATNSGFISVDIGLNYSELFDLEKQTSLKVFTVEDIGDLSTWNAYEIIDADGAEISSPVKLNAKASFTVSKDNVSLICFDDGVIVND